MYDDEGLRQEAEETVRSRSGSAHATSRRRESGQRSIRIPDRTVHHALEHPKQIDRGEDHAIARAGPKNRRAERLREGERAGITRKLPTNPLSPAVERGEDEHAEDVVKSGHMFARPPRSAIIAMCLLVLDADEEEESTGHKPVVEHLQYRRHTALKG